MPRKGDSQLSLNLDAPQTSKVKPAQKVQARDAPSSASIYSFTEKKTAKDNAEETKHFLNILELVRHFK